MRKGARKEFGSLQHLGRRAERWRDILVQRLADTEVSTVFFLLEPLNIFVSTRSHVKRLGISKVPEIVKEIVLKEFWGLLKLDREGPVDNRPTTD